MDHEVPRSRKTSRARHLVLLAATLALGCNAVFGIDAGKRRPMCADPDLIDDMEDREAMICDVNGRHGGWYRIGDGTSADLEPGPGPTFKPTLIEDKRPGSTSQYAAHFRGSGFSIWGALMGFNFNEQGEARRTYDAGLTGGITFWMKSNVSVSVDFLTPSTVLPAFAGTCTEAAHNCNNAFSFKITAPSGQWTEYHVPYTALHQSGGGTAVWNPSELLGVQFQVGHDAAFDVWIDDISFYPCSTGECLPTCDDPTRTLVCPATNRTPEACRAPEAGCGAALASCADPLLIDDMEDGDADICTSRAQSGSWFAFGDGTGTDLAPGSGRFFEPTLIPGGRGASHYAAHRMGTGFTNWGALMGFQFNLPAEGTQTYDASAFAGIKFWMKSARTVHVDFPIPETIPREQGGTCDGGLHTENCNNHFSVALRASNDWVEYQVPFGALSQPAHQDMNGNGRLGTATFTPSRLVSIDFRTPPADFDVWVDDVRFYTCEIAACIPRCSDLRFPVACPAIGGYSASCRPPGSDCSVVPNVSAYTGVWGSGPDDVWVAGYSISKFTGSILHWDGAAWSRPSTGIGLDAPPIWGLWGGAANNVWAVGDRGTILRWDGSTWSLTSSPTISPLRSVWGDNIGGIWAVQYPATLVHWDDSSSWSTAVSGAGNLWSVWGSSPEDVWAVGPQANTAHWDGSIWTAAPSGTNNLWSVWGSGPADVWAVGDNGTILHWDGKVWTPSASGTSVALGGVWGSGPDDVWVVGEGGTILRGNGSTWIPVNSGTRYSLHSVWGSGPDDVWAVGYFGTILHWDGKTWAQRG